MNLFALMQDCPLLSVRDATAVFTACSRSADGITMNARSLMNFLSLRTKHADSHFPSFPQREIEMVAERVAKGYEARTGRKKKLTGVQMGYESRCAAPHAFDVMLGSQLGIGAYRALVEEGLDGHMVSVTGQLDLRYVAFKELINPETLITEVRFVKPGSDFHRLARFLETRVDSESFEIGRRNEK